MLAVCPHCEARTEVELQTRNETVTIRKEAVEIAAEFFVCVVCGNEFVDGGQMDSNLEKARAVYRERNSVLSPKDIIAIRTKYDVSQKTFAKLLDIGELTINTYEQGILPSGAHNSLLALVAEPDNFTKLFNTNKESLSPRQRLKVEKALASIKEACAYEYAAPDERDDNLMVAEAEIPFHGRTSVQIEQMLSLIQLIILYIDRPLYKMAVLKLLFYIDFSYYRHYDHSMTGWSYARLPFGPVPNDYKDLLYKGEKCGRFELQPDSAETGEILILPEGFDVVEVEAGFTPSELDIVKRVVAKLGKQSAGHLRDKSHEEPAWLETAPAQLIAYSFAKRLVHGV